MLRPRAPLEAKAVEQRQACLLAWVRQRLIVGGTHDPTSQPCFHSLYLLALKAPDVAVNLLKQHKALRQFTANSLVHNIIWNVFGVSTCNVWFPRRQLIARVTMLPFVEIIMMIQTTSSGGFATAGFVACHGDCNRHHPHTMPPLLHY